MVEIDITNVKLETKNFILRAFCEDDLDDLYEYAKVPGVGEMAGWIHHQSIEESKRVLDLFITQKKVFAIYSKADKKVIGSIGIEEGKTKEFDDLNYRYRELGFILSKDYWGKGIMVECANRVIDYCFEDLKFDVITCCHFNSNYQSKRVQEKLGFEFFKTIIFKNNIGFVEESSLNVMTKEMWLNK